MYNKYLPNLPLVQERFWNSLSEDFKSKYKEEYKRHPEFEFYVFPQTWGSTSLGFGGFGGQAITEAYTVVMIDRVSGIAGVFFNERLAYAIEKPNEKFYEDLHNFNMKEVMCSSEYERN